MRSLSYLRTISQYDCTSEDFPGGRSPSQENPERGAQGEALSAFILIILE